ncbi:AraC family transcriptional regulator ligand-binding domain-containing protein [Pseudomonas sp. PWP3-1b2]|uniref:AraC family transcriptional regulator n=1 Tax=Pseudomonas sp. PWP3-1b2 TaxID=2804656 RepID=UPI003CEF8B43
MTTKNALSSGCQLPQSFWQALVQLKLEPAAVLRHANLPESWCLDETVVMSPSQLFAIWDAVEALSGDATSGIRMVTETSTAKHMLAFLAATYAADFRDGLTRLARFKRMCSPDRLCFEKEGEQLIVTIEWPVGTPPEPYIAVEASFALLLEVGRRGTGKRILPVSVDLRRTPPASSHHGEFFGCPVRFGAQRDRLVLNSTDLDVPFPAHNPELLRMLTPALASAVDNIESHASLSARVKATLKLMMTEGRTDIGSVARELALSPRTLQRKIAAEGKTFRVLLAEARNELSRELLNVRGIEVKEVAYLVGYQDTNSFYRAFRGQEKVTPSTWRRAHRSKLT